MSLETGLRRRLLVYGPALLLLTLLQFQLSVSAAFAVPDFLFLLPLLAAMWTPGYDGFVLGLAAGFIRDFAAGRGYGPGMLLGMVLALCGQAAAGRGWKQYLSRLGILLFLSTVFHDGLLTLLAWFMPLGIQTGSLALALKLFIYGLPTRLLANLAGAALLSGLFALAFYSRKKDDGSPAIDFRGGEIQDA